MIYRDLGFRARLSTSSTISLIGRIAGRPRAPLPSNSTSASSPLGSQVPRSSAESGCSLEQQKQLIKVCLPMCELNTFRIGSLPPAVREECLPRGHRRGSSLPGNLLLLLLSGVDLGGRRSQRHQSSRETVSITRPGLHKLTLRPICSIKIETRIRKSPTMSNIVRFSVGNQPATDEVWP